MSFNDYRDHRTRNFLHSIRHTYQPSGFRQWSLTVSTYSPLSKSIEIVRNCFWTVFGITVLVGIAASIASFILGFLTAYRCGTIILTVIPAIQYCHGVFSLLVYREIPEGVCLIYSRTAKQQAKNQGYWKQYPFWFISRLIDTASSCCIGNYIHCITNTRVEAASQTPVSKLHHKHLHRSLNLCIRYGKILKN